MDVDRPGDAAGAAGAEAQAAVPELAAFPLTPAESVDAAAAAPAAAPASAAPAADDAVFSDGVQTVKSDVRHVAIHIRGVDDFSTRDIEAYVTRHYTKPFSIEWIDDTSLNIVYQNGDDAFESLVAITAPEELERAEPIRPEEDRRARPDAKHADAALFVRFAFATDRKADHARAKSRYYLLHGEPTRRDDLVRFGTKRSVQPKLYGDKEVDIVGSLGSRHRLDDLFPTKSGAAESGQLPDLLDEIGKRKRGGRGRKRGRRGRGRDELPDLFGDKFAPRKADAGAEKRESEGNAVFKNMDY